MLRGLFGGKSSSNDTPNPAAQAAPQLRFQVLTLNDIPKFSASAQPTVVPAISNPQPIEPHSGRIALVQGAIRNVPEESYQQSSPDGLQSCAASIVTNGVSPITPASGNKTSKFEHLFRNRSRRRRDEDISPISALETVDENSATRNYGVSEDDYEDDPFENRQSYATSSVYDDRSSINDPFADSRRTRYSNQRTGSQMPPRLNTTFLAPNPYSPSARFEASRYSNPFGNTPQHETHPSSFGQGSTPVSAIEPVSQEIRFSDCGVNPFNGLDDSARRERESSGGVSNLWDMIVGGDKQSKKTMPSPRIHIDTSALDQESSSGLSRSRSLMYSRPPDSADAVSPAEWFSNLLIDYEGRPPEISRAMSYIPTPISAHPPGLSPQEITANAVPYLASLEAELEELRNYKADKEAQERAQDERDRVRSLIQRQLANEQAIDALTKAIGGKRMTREQLESPNIWTEIDLSGAAKTPINDRRSMETVWPGIREENAPPVSKISASHQNTSTKSRATAWPNFVNEVPPVPKVRGPIEASKPKPSRGLFGWVTKRPKEERISSSSRNTQEIPMVLDSTTRAPQISSVNTPAFPEPFAQQSPLSQRDPSIVEQHFASEDDKSDGEGYIDEKRIQNTDTDSKYSLGSPPPYSTRGNPNLHSDYSNSKSEPRVDEASLLTPGRRIPIKLSNLPKLSTGTTTDEHEPPRPLVRAVGISQMQFTPTTPHHARSYQIYGQQSRATPRQQISLESFAHFGNKRPGDIRDAAEKKRRNQEKRERLFRRGGWLWLCGLCCGVRQMTRKMKIFWWTFLIVLIVAPIIAGTIVGVKKSNEKPPVIPEAPVEMLTLSNFPSMPVNFTVTPRLMNTVSTCVTPSTMWSCLIPPPLVDSTNNGRPIFNWRVVNDSNSIPNPIPIAEDYKKYSKVDNVIGTPFEGEPTGFYISLLASESSLPGNTKRSHTRHFPRQTTDISPLPPAVMLPIEYTFQQLRLFDRERQTEHFKFMTYFHKTIYLRSINVTNDLDKEGGVSPPEARYKCELPNTRFITKIFTRAAEKDSSGQSKVIVDPNTAAPVRVDNAGRFAGYPVEIEEDLANYTSGLNGTCWEINDMGVISNNIPTDVIVVQGMMTGKIDDGNFRGCQCSWSNFKPMSGNV